MVRAWSRDFLLTVCGVFLLLIALIVIFVKIDDKVEVVNNKIRLNNIIENIDIYKESIELKGQGNFYEEGPLYDKLELKNFNVILSNSKDEINYNMRFCNNSLEDIKLENITIGDIQCFNKDNAEMDCGNVVINKNYLDDNNKLINQSIIKKDECFNTLISISYDNKLLNDDLIINVSQFNFNIKLLEK